jgi:putative ABC transport system permease protein
MQWILTGDNMLLKNVIRTLKKQSIQLILLGIIIMLSSFIYTTMDYSIKGLLEPTEKYFEEANQEDFAIKTLDVITPIDQAVIVSNCPIINSLDASQFPITISQLYQLDKSCYDDVIDNRMNNIEEAYPNVLVEMREYKDIYFDLNGNSVRFRVLKEMDQINTTYILKGNAPLSDNEITVTEIFAKKNNLVIGDTLNINDKNYTISAFALFPDYSLALFTNDLIMDNKTQSVVTMTDSAFAGLNEPVSFEIAGTYPSSMTDDEFREEVIETFSDNQKLAFIATISLTINNLRSGAIYAELAGGRAMNLILSLLIASIGLLIVGIMVSKVLQTQRGPIGILKSLGYKNSEIALPYIFFIGVLALPMIIIGYFLGLYAAEPFKNIYLDFYLLPYQPIEQSFVTILVAIIVPFTFIVGTSYLIIMRMLNQKPVTLLNPVVSNSKSKFALLVAKILKPFKVTTKLQHLLLYRNMVKFFVYLIGMFSAAYLILFSFSMNGIIDRMIFDYYDNTSHEYIGYCDYQSPCEVPENAEKVIEVPSVLLDSKEVSLVGLDSNNHLHPLYDNHQNEITNQLDNGFVITKSLSLIEHVYIGDEVKISIGDKEITGEVVEISEEYGASKVYVNRDTIGVLIADNAEYFNTVYSSEELDKNDYVLVSEIDTILSQVVEMQRFFQTFITIMISISIIIGAIIVYILTALTIEDNFYNISLFKVLGYNNKEINKMVLGGYFIYGIIIFVAAIPVAVLSYYILEVFFADFYEMLFPVAFKWWHGLLSLVIYGTIFYIGAYHANKKMKAISLQESMKMYQI